MNNNLLNKNIEKLLSKLSNFEVHSKGKIFLIQKISITIEKEEIKLKYKFIMKKTYCFIF